MLSVLLAVVVVLVFSTRPVYSVSCELGGRSACIASCKLQNCATGYCNDKVCVCSRCSRPTKIETNEVTDVVNSTKVIVSTYVKEEGDACCNAVCSVRQCKICCPTSVEAYCSCDWSARRDPQSICRCGR